MWGVSNEAPTTDVDGLPQAYYYERIASLAHVVRQTEAALGTWHPVTVPVTCDLHHMDWFKAAQAPIDIWGFNCYWAAAATWPTNWYAAFKQKSNGLPLVITEFGMDSYDNRVDRPFEHVQAEYTATQWTLLMSPRGSGGLSLGGIVFEWMDEPWKAAAFEARPAATACVPHRGGVHAGWAPLARPTNFAADAFPDRCGNDAFFGMVELLPNDTIRPKLVTIAIKRAWAPIGGLSSLALVGGAGAALPAGAAPIAPPSGSATRSALVATALVLSAVIFAAQLLYRRRQHVRCPDVETHSGGPDCGSSQQPLRPTQEGEDRDYRLM